MAGRFLPQRDRDFLERVNKELVGDLKKSNDGIINQNGLSAEVLFGSLGV